MSRHGAFMGKLDGSVRWRSCAWVRSEGTVSVFMVGGCHPDLEAELRLSGLRVEAVGGASSAGVDLRVEDVGQADPD